MILRLAVRNALRNRRRSGLTATTVFLGTALATVALSWIQGVLGQISDVASRFGGHVRVVTPAWEEREDLFPLEAVIDPVDPVLAAVRGTPGIVAAWPRIQAPVGLSVGEDLAETFALATGAEPSWYAEILDVDGLLVAGRGLDGEGEAVLGRNVADRLHAGPGDDVIVLGQTRDGAPSPVRVTVTGVIGAGNGLVDQGIYLHLDTMRWIVDAEDGAVEVVGYGADRWSARRLAAAVRTQEGARDLAVTAWSDRDPMGSLLILVDAMRAILAGAVVVVTSLAVWNTMMMSVLERTREIGVLRAMGMSRAGIVGLFAVEALTIASLGGLAGTALGALGACYLEVVGIEFGERAAQNVSTEIPISTVMRGDLTWEVALTGFGLGLAMALVGSVLPAWRAAAVEPVEAMRQ